MTKHGFCILLIEDVTPIGQFKQQTTPGTERNLLMVANPMHAICHTPPNPKIILCHWLFFLGYVPYLELHLVLKLSVVLLVNTLSQQNSPNPLQGDLANTLASQRLFC